MSNDSKSITAVTVAGEQEEAAADERNAAGWGRGGRGGRGGRRGKRAGSVGPEDQSIPGSPAAPPRGTSKGKRKADAMEGSSAQQAKHVLKRKEKSKPPSCPMCHSDTILACDRLEGVSFAELKMIMG